MLHTAAHGATCLKRVFEFDNSDATSWLICWILWTCSLEGVRSWILIHRGNPTPSQSRLNALFQIEKNFSKEVSKRSREESDQGVGVEA